MDDRNSFQPGEETFEDVEGHLKAKNALPDDDTDDDTGEDTEGHARRVALPEDADDVEGHTKRPN